MNERKNDFTQGSILKKLIAFMLPVLAALVLQAAYGAVDILVVGRFGTTAGISGVSTGSNMVNMVVFTIAGFSMGLTVLIGKYLGERKPEKIGSLIGGVAVLFTILSVLIAVIMLLFADPLARLMQAPQEALELTKLYIRICGGGIFFIIAYNVIAAIFRGLGDSKTPLLFVLIACIVNIGGDLLFVAGFHMNVAGAALATVLAQAVSVILSLLIMKKRGLPFLICRHDFRINAEVKNFVRVGIPIALQEFLTQLSFLALCAFINRLGLEASSGYGVANKVTSFVMLVPSALMQSMASFVAQNVGAGLEKRSRKSMFTGMGVGMVVGCLVFLFIFTKGYLVTGLFSTDEAVVMQAWDYLRGFGTDAFLTSVMFSMVGYFNGHEQSLFVMIQGIAQTFLVRLPVSYFMSIQPNTTLTKIGYAAPLATIFGITLNVIYYVYYTNKMKKEGVIH